jgi:hypothetical protein
METVMLRSGKVEVILGSNVIDQTGKISGYAGITQSAAAGTASIAPIPQTQNSILTVTVLASGGFFVGNVISGSGILYGTYILQQLTGTTNGVGTYLVTNSQTFASGAITADGSGLPAYKNSAWGTFQAVFRDTSGSGTATITILGSNDGVYWASTALGTIVLTGTSPQSDGFNTVAPWKYIKAVLSSLTGTGASVYVLMGI